MYQDRALHITYYKGFMIGMDQDGFECNIQSYLNFIGMYQDRALRIHILKASWKECTKMENLGMYRDRALHIHMIKALLVNRYVIDLLAEQLTRIFEVLVLKLFNL